MDNITQFILMLHGFAKFNEVQPNIKQWNKIVDDWENIMSIDSYKNLIDISVTLAEKETFEDFIVAINSVEQVPTSEQWRNIKIVTGKTIENLKNYIHNDYSYTLEDELDYSYPDDLIPEAHFDYEYETRQCVAATEIIIPPNNYVLSKNIDIVDVPFTISTVDDELLSVNISDKINDSIKVLDDFIVNSYKQKTFEF